MGTSCCCTPTTSTSGAGGCEAALSLWQLARATEMERASRIQGIESTRPISGCKRFDFIFDIPYSFCDHGRVENGQVAASLNAAVLTSCYDTVLYAPYAKNEMPRNLVARQREITLCVTVRSETCAP